MSGEDIARAALVKQAHASITQGSHSFAVASRLFGRETRERAWLLYCWCRAADDLTDGQEAGHAGRAPEPVAGNPLAQQARLVELTRAALDDVTPVPLPFAALRQLSREVDIPRQWIDDLLEGFALDAQGWRPQSTDDLLRYCYHVAGSVGRMMAVVMGVEQADTDTLDRACDLGIAFQLANIARDLVPDAATGRIYLPAEWLEEAGLAPETLGLAANREVLAGLAGRLVHLARDYRASARVGAARLPLRSRLAVLAAEAIYGEIGERVIRKGPAAWDTRVRIIGSQKVALLAVAAARSARPSPAASRHGLWTAPV
jgi:phytoene synthase